MDQRSTELNIAVFFCQQIDPDQDTNRRALEKDLGGKIRFFPLPCSGRIDPLHLMRAIESGADMVYLITCAEGACRYREGNLRAKKRLAYTQGLLEEIGLERERLELVAGTGENSITIDMIANRLLMREPKVGPSPLRAQQDTHIGSCKGARP